MQWVGSFHFIFLHFPIALIAMTVISELLFAWYASPLFDYASRFMLIAAAILAVPTALLGLTYSYTATYDGILADFVWWHMWFGFATAILPFCGFYSRALGNKQTLLYVPCSLIFACEYRRIFRRRNDIWAVPHVAAFFLTKFKGER